MNEKQRNLENNPEFEALKKLEGLDQDSLMEQAGLAPAKPPVEDDAPTPPAPVDDAGGVDAGGVDTPATDKPADVVPEQRDDILKEIFGDRFKTVDEAKQANISGLFDEAESLREAKADLEAKLSVKPKTNFANDEVALYNEFVKETGTKNYGVFSKINTADVSTMDSMEALVTKYTLDHPEFTGKEENIKKYFEKKYNVDPDLVDEEDIAVNKIGMEADGSIAKKSLQSLKEKLKIPEPQEDEAKPEVLSPEELSTLQKGWNNVGQQVSTALEKLKVPIKNGKESLLDYEISDSEKKEITDFVEKYAVENQMELNDNNVKIVSSMVYNQLMINNLPNIVHSVFEKARSLTQEQVHSLYENPSPNRNNDAPPPSAESAQSDEEKMKEAIFNAEMGNI
ncbi:MAG: hypothetical protein PF440_00170 [Thiomicrorhabdus sp.]|jgi:hypothetical protein|nr:hypothetical protein [Thiomicrorhabdus sp.]